MIGYGPSIDGIGGEITGTIGQANGLSSDIVSYTNVISGRIEQLQYTDEFTLITAPDWYAPKLPRDMANVGWTFENLNATDGSRYSINQWAGFFGSTVAMPFKLAFNVWELFRFFGPFGLFITWLVLMAIFVFNIEVLAFLKNGVWGIYEFAVKTIQVIWYIFDWLWRVFKWLIDWTWKIVNWFIDLVFKVIEAIPVVE